MHSNDPVPARLFARTGFSSPAPGKKVIDTFDSFRKKRNVSSYDVAGSVSDKEADEMLKLATMIRADVENWIKATRSELFER